jgi:uncharacterized membrane protein
MLAQITKFHRFLASQSLYPLILSSFLCGIFLFGRFIYSDNFEYRNLVLNLFLAWIPYIFSLFAIILFILSRKLWWLILIAGIIWLIFFPNAPYIVTDFYHLVERPPVPLWYDIGLIAIFAFTGCFLAIASLRTMHYLVQKYMGWFIGWIFVATAIGLAGLGIYMGRFGRWNSWDIILNPSEIIKDITIRVINPLNNLRFVGFTMMFTAILLVFYLMFISMRRIDELDQNL